MKYGIEVVQENFMKYLQYYVSVRTKVKRLYLRKHMLE